MIIVELILLPAVVHNCWLQWLGLKGNYPVSEEQTIVQSMRPN